jgi:hypothetical protein
LNGGSSLYNGIAGSINQRMCTTVHYQIEHAFRVATQTSVLHPGNLYVNDKMRSMIGKETHLVHVT